MSPATRCCHTPTVTLKTEVYCSSPPSVVKNSEPIKCWRMSLLSTEEQNAKEALTRLRLKRISCKAAEHKCCCLIVLTQVCLIFLSVVLKACSVSVMMNEQTGGAVIVQPFKPVPWTWKAFLCAGFRYRQSHCFGPAGTYGFLAKFEMGNIFVAAEPQPNRMASHS